MKIYSTLNKGLFTFLLPSVEIFLPSTLSRDIFLTIKYYIIVIWNCLTHIKRLPCPWFLPDHSLQWPTRVLLVLMLHIAAINWELRSCATGQLYTYGKLFTIFRVTNHNIVSAFEVTGSQNIIICGFPFLVNYSWLMNSIKTTYIQACPRHCPTPRCCPTPRHC